MAELVRYSCGWDVNNLRSAFQPNPLYNNLLMHKIFDNGPEIVTVHEVSERLVLARCATWWVAVKACGANEQVITLDAVAPAVAAELFAVGVEDNRYVAGNLQDERRILIQNMNRILALVYAGTDEEVNNRWPRYFAGEPRAANDRYVADQATDIQVREFVYSHMGTVRDTLRMPTAHALTICCLAYSKRGTASDNLIDKISQQVGIDLGCNIRLTSIQIATFHNNMGHYVTADNARFICTELRNRLNNYPNGLRLTLLINRMSGSGLTTYIIIGRAMRMYPNFAWRWLVQIAPADFEHYNAATRIVGDNPFYGFSRDLQAFKSTNYKTLGYTCSRLLAQCNGEGGLGGYGGFRQGVVQRQAIDARIAAFIEERAQQNAPNDRGEYPRNERYDQILNETLGQIDDVAVRALYLE